MGDDKVVMWVLDEIYVYSTSTGAHVDTVHKTNLCNINNYSATPKAYRKDDIYPFLYLFAKAVSHRPPLRNDYSLCKMQHHVTNVRDRATRYTRESQKATKTRGRYREIR